MSEYILTYQFAFVVATGLWLVAGAKFLDPSFYENHTSARLKGLAACAGALAVALAVIAFDGLRDSGRTGDNILLLIAAIQAGGCAVLFATGATRRANAALKNADDAI